MTGYFLTWISAWFTFIRYFFLVGSSNRKNIYHIFSRKALILCSSFLVAKHTLEMLVWLILKDSLKINSNDINHAWSSHDHKFFFPASTPSYYSWNEASERCFLCWQLRLQCFIPHWTSQLVGPFYFSSL